MKRLICFFLLLSLMVGLLPALPLDAKAEEASIENTAELWIDFAAESFAGGTGSESKPYLIATAEQLALLAVRANSGIGYSGIYFELVDHIDLSACPWVPIGQQESTPFKGYFNGNGYTISGMTLNNNSVAYDYCGLFGFSSYGSISNLNLTDVSIDLLDHSGGLYVGCVAGHAGRCINIEVSGDISVIRRSGVPRATCGGLVGSAEEGSLNSSFTGSIYVSCPASISAGGIHGNVDNDNIEMPTQNCRSTGSIVIESTYKGDGTYDSFVALHVGGITGFDGQGFTNCYSSMNISVKGYNGAVGGIAGLLQDDIKNCYATGTVSLTTAYTDLDDTGAYAGGLVGDWYSGNISNCYTRNPSVTCTMTNATQQTYAGKLVGYHYEETTATVTNSYVTAGTALKRNGFKDGGDCDADSYPVVTSAHSTNSQPETGAFTYSESFITDTLGWQLYTNYHGNMLWANDAWILSGDNPTLYIDHVYSLTVRYWDPGSSIFDVSLTYHSHGSEYSVASPESSGNTPDQPVVSGTITENTYLDVYYTHEHTPGPEATCTAPQTCTTCRAVLTELLPHDYAVTEVLQPSCTENGYTLRTCQSCGGTHRDSYVSPLGHALDLSNICTRCGISFEAPLRDYRVHVRDQETGKPIEGASVYLGGSTILTDTAGIAAHQLSSEGPLGMTVRFEGYQTHNLSNFLPGELPDTYVFLSASDTGIYEARCNGKDVLLSSAQINILAPTLEATVVVKGRSKAGITHYELVQGSAIIATSEDGVFTVKNPHFKKDQPVYARMHTDGAEGSNVFSRKLNIAVIGFSLDADTDWGKLLPFSAGMDLSFPEGTPVLEGLNIKIPSYAVGKDGYVNVQVGNEKLMITFGDKNDLNDSKEDLDTKTKTQLLKKMRDDWVKRNNPNAWPEGTKENEVAASFGMVIEFSGSGVKSVYGQANIAYNLSYENGKTFLIWYIPIYAEICTSFGGELRVTNLGYDFENAQVLTPDFRLSVNGQITLREGFGCSVLSAGVYGTAGASLVFGMEDLQEYISYRLYGELGLYARLKLFFWKAMEYRLPLLSGEFSGSTGIRARRAMYSLRGYETVSRDYLKNRSSWLSYVPRTGSIPENATLQTSSYTALEPKLVICGDTVMMVFMDDSGSNGLNYQHLYYSLFQAETGVWSQPKRVDDNDLCDLEYEVCTDGSRIWIVYTQMDAVTEDNQEAYGQLLSTVEVTAAVYDPEQDAFADHSVLTDDESFDTLPQLAMTPEGLRAAWVSNVTNDAFSQNANNRLFTALYSGGSWSQPLALTQPGATVVSMDLGLLKNAAYIASVRDVDCDLATIEDRVLVLTDMNGTDTAVPTDKNTNDAVQFGVLGGSQSLLWYRDANLYAISAPSDLPTALFAEPVKGLSTSYRLLPLSATQQAIVYTNYQRWTDAEGSEQGGSNLQAIFCNNGNWSKPIPLTQPEAGRYVEGYDIHVLNGKLLMPYISMSATVTDSDIQRSADFRCTYTAVPQDLVVGQAVSLPSQLLNQDVLEFKVPYVNNSPTALKSLNYRITDPAGTLLKEGTPSVLTDSGEEGWLTVTVSRSLLTAGTDYTVTLLPVGWTDEDTSNNNADLNLWYGDLSVTAGQLLLENQQVHYAVSNEGNDVAHGTLEILLKEEDGSETLLHTAPIAPLAPGKTFTGALDVDSTLCDANRVVLVRATAVSPELYDFNNETGLTLQSLAREDTTEVPDTDIASLSPEFPTPYVTYNRRYGGSLSVPVTDNGWTLASFSGVASDGFSYSSGTLVLNSNWLQGLNIGSHTLTLGYQKNSQTTKITLILEVIDTTPPPARITATDQIFRFTDSAPQLGKDILYETDSQGKVSASYSKDGNTGWNSGLPNRLGTYYVRLYVSEDALNNLSEASCVFTLEVIKGRRAISLPQVAPLANGSWRFDRAVPTAGASDGVITYGYSTVNDPATVAQWSDTGLIPAPDSSVTYYLFARITDGENFEDAFSLGKALHIHIHTYETAVTAPTCETPGFTSHTCSVCEESHTDSEIPALGHSFTNYVNDNNATCTIDGTEHAQCTRCDKVDVRILAGTATGHSFDEGVITTQPGCTEAGIMTFTCGCGEQYTAVLPASGHRYDTAVTPPGCEEAGFTTHTCSVCGNSYTDGQQSPTGHSFDEGVITIHPDCTHPGVLTFTCGSCGFQYISELSATGHRYEASVTAAPTCEVQGIMTHRCAACGDAYEESISATGHRYNATVTAPTCEASGFTTYLCDLCSHSYIDAHTAALGHSFTDYQSDDNATCEADGTKTAYCDRCEAVDTVTDPGTALGHLYDGGTVTQAPDCVRDGTLVYHCERCDGQREEILAATGHRYEDTVTAPGCDRGGFTTHICALCGDTFKDSFTPATGHSYVEGYCQVCGGFQPGYCIYSGTVKSYGSPTDPITVQLFPEGSLSAAYSTTLTNHSTTFRFSGIALGRYTLTVSKKNHVTLYHTVTAVSGTMATMLEIHLLGDITGEGKVNVGDVAQLYSHIRKSKRITDEYALSCAEVTGDGKLNVGDTATLYSHVRNTKKLY